MLLTDCAAVLCCAALLLYLPATPAPVCVITGSVVAPPSPIDRCEFEKCEGIAKFVGAGLASMGTLVGGI